MNVISEKQVKTKNYESLVEELKNTLNFQLKDLFTRFFTKSDDIIFDLASEAGSNEEQSKLFELLHSIRIDKANISRGLTKAIKEYLIPVRDIQSDTDNTFELISEDNSEELSLVSQDTMEELVLINSITSKTVDKFSNEIGLLERRLEFLEKKTNTVFKKDALTPKHFCLSFQKSIDILESGVSDKLILYKLFEKEVASNLNEIYDTLNKMLVEAGILPDIKLYSDSKNKRKNQFETTENNDEVQQTVEAENLPPEQKYLQATSSPHNSVNAGANSQTLNTANTSSVSKINTSTTPVKNIDPLNTANNIGEQKVNCFEDTITTLASPAVITEQNPLSGDRSYGNHHIEKEHSSKAISGRPVEETNRIINDFIGRDSTDSGSATGNSQYYGHKDVLTALTEMQINVRNDFDNNTVSVINTDKLRHSILETIASQDGGAITKQVSNDIEKTIDFIKLIFDAIIEDDSISDAVKTLLLTLQIPVIKASMLDHNFFIDDNHPARQLLDKISELGVGVSSHTDPIFQSIQKIIKDLLADYTEDLGAFVTARDNLQFIIDELAAEAATKEKIEHVSIQKAHARRVVLKELRKATLSMRIPKQTHKLILTVWPTLMFNHFLKNGKENNEWINLITTLSNIINSIQKPENHYQYTQLQNSHESILKEVNSIIKNTKRYKDHVKEISSGLQKTYSDSLKDSPHSKPDKDESNLTNKNVVIQLSKHLSDKADIESNTKKEALQLLPKDVMPGAWFRVDTENGRARRLKLSIIIIEEALLVFVDHNGVRVIEKEATEFMNDINNNRAQLIMSHSIFDHALTSAVDNIRH